MEYYKHYKALKETLKRHLEHKESYPQIDPYQEYSVDEVDEFTGKYLDELSDFFKDDYLKNYKTNYFLGCSFEVYERTYNERFEAFKVIYYDADEVDFLTAELDEGVLEHKFIFLDIDKTTSTQILYSLKKRVLFIEQRLIINGYELVGEEDAAGAFSYSVERVEKNLETSKGLKVNKKKESDLPKWFPIGLGFAIGEIQREYKNKNSARKIAKEYNLDDYHNYISNTINNSNIKDPKNIYSDLDKMKIIFVHCIENNIIVCEDFKKAYDTKLLEIN